MIFDMLSLGRTIVGWKTSTHPSEWVDAFCVVKLKKYKNQREVNLDEF
jgi:hypothetical protein